MSGDVPNRANIQANVLRGSSRWRFACYVFLRITDLRAGADLVTGLLAGSLVATAESVYPKTPESNVNIALSHDGLGLVGATFDDGSRFERDFLLRPEHHERTLAADDGPPRSAFEAGMRSANLDDTWPEREGDIYRWSGGAEADAWWTDDLDPKPWRGADEWPHILVWISAVSDTVRADVLADVRSLIEATDGATEIGCQFAHALDDNKEHFGFVDGVSQPAIEGFRPGKPGDGKLSARGWQGFPVGEFILGYGDEGFGSPKGLGVNTIARDGTFLVYRKLRQDVEAFRATSYGMAQGSHLNETRIGEKIMGRRHDGTPLIVPPGTPDPPSDRSLWNDFTYANDRDGARCPFGSHIRRANPRDDLHFEGRRVNRHRIIRRGMTYGEPYDSQAEEDDGDRGLIFIAFNARIEDQFEFIQKQWLNGGRTFRLGDDPDPIAGNGENIRIVINGEQPILHCQPLPFTRFLGGDYFFVPGISMLEQIASGTARQAALAGRPPTES